MQHKNCRNIFEVQCKLIIKIKSKAFLISFSRRFVCDVKKLFKNCCANQLYNTNRKASFEFYIFFSSHSLLAPCTENIFKRKWIFVVCLYSTVFGNFLAVFVTFRFFMYAESDFLCFSNIFLNQKTSFLFFELTLNWIITS